MTANNLFHNHQRLFRLAAALTLLLLAAALSAGCTGTPLNVGHSESLVRRLEHEAPSGDSHQEGRTLKRSQFDFEHLLADRSYTEAIQDGEVPAFSVLTRTDQMSQFPCSSCHDEELEAQLAAEGLPLGVEGLEHWDVSLDHASEEVMDCATCHSSDGMDQLHTLTGTPIEFDASYQLCAQCHNNQFEDWLGGAHGKRVGGWAAPRVVESCMGCHNPHQPGFDTRWPAVINGGS